jgi:hypothetical protein
LHLEGKGKLATISTGVAPEGKSVAPGGKSVAPGGKKCCTWREIVLHLEGRNVALGGKKGVLNFFPFRKMLNL